MRKVKVAAVQMRCTRDVNANIANAERLVRKAAADGAQIILLPELFERQYFCQERQYEYYEFAKPVEENDAVKHFAKVAEELKVVLPISFYEKDGKRLFNTVAILDADGTNLGIYRKTHIPDDHYYQEKFYFTPGDTGFKAFKTRYGTIGVGICWDQWFPETARFMAVKGAELLFYPTAKAVPVLVLGVPSRYVHTHYNFCAKSDLEAAADLAVEVIRGLDAEKIRHICRQDILK